MAGGAAETDFIATTNAPGMGAILADAKDLKDGNNTVPNLSTNLPVRVFQIIQEKDLWWFNGEKPDGFNQETTLTANSGGFVAGESYFWFIPVGNDKAAFGEASSKTTTINQVDINSMGSSAYTNNDVAIALNVNNVLVNGRYQTHIYAPYKLNRVSIDHEKWMYFGNIPWPNAFKTTIQYKIVDNFNRNIDQDIDVNEEFPSGSPNDITNNWPNFQVNQGDPPNAPGGIFPDHIMQRNDLNNPLTPLPQVPGPLQSPPIPLSTIKVIHGEQIWRVGSITTGRGVPVQKDRLQKFIDHGDALDVTTPIP